jgi:hypothetical protein
LDCNVFRQVASSLASPAARRLISTSSMLHSQSGTGRFEAARELRHHPCPTWGLHDDFQPMDGT